MHREPVVAAQQESLARSAGHRCDPVRVGGRFNDEPGNDASIVVDIELRAPDTPTQGFNNVIEESGERCGP